jgi:ribosomal protein L10
MAVSKTKKVSILAQIEKELQGATSIAFTSNTKLTVEEITNLRRDLRKVDAKFMLAKKTLIRIAFKNVYNVELNEDIMPGQVAVVISK